jgi:RNA polymerase sigma-70 factor (ECF subfamily)
MDELPLKHREIILLRHYQDLDYAAIAEVLEIPIGTVMSRLYHARKKMQVLMDPYMDGKS